MQCLPHTCLLYQRIFYIIARISLYRLLAGKLAESVLHSWSPNYQGRSSRTALLHELLDSHATHRIGQYEGLQFFRCHNFIFRFHFRARHETRMAAPRLVIVKLFPALTCRSNSGSLIFTSYEPTAIFMTLLLPYILIESGI